MKEESFPEGTTEKTIDPTTASLRKRPRSSYTSPLSDIALKKPRENSPTVIGKPVFKMVSDLTEDPSWLGSLKEKSNNVKAFVTEQISSMNDKVGSVLKIVNNDNEFKESVTNKVRELEGSVNLLSKSYDEMSTAEKKMWHNTQGK